MNEILNPADYRIITAIFPKLLGVIYFFVFGAFLFQIKGLLGENGILPIKRYHEYVKERLGRNRYYYFPSVFWLNSSNAFLIAIMAIGTGLSLLLTLGIYPPLILLLLYILHLSLVSSGQEFLSFGWESLLLEITFNTIFLTWMSPANPFIWISLNILLFRFHFQAGMSKLLSHDKTWRDLTALSYHYLTQPLPNTLAWYMHKLPMSFHKISTIGMFFCEIIVPFGIFGNDEIRLVTFVLLFGLQFTIWLTGNLSYLNHLTIAFTTLLISDKYLTPFFGSDFIPLEISTVPLPLNIIASVFGTILIFLQLISFWNYFLPNQIFSKILYMLSPFHLANRYGLFAVMTTKRYEIIVEGSHDGIKWQEYIFKYKPSELKYRPKRVSPYQPRLDWQAWFLPFRPFGQEAWFPNFLSCLLIGSPDVLQLLKVNPFPENPPLYIRAAIYDYEFTSIEEKKKTGAWWQRHFIGYYSQILSLKQKL